MNDRVELPGDRPVEILPAELDAVRDVSEALAARCDLAGPLLLVRTWSDTTPVLRDVLNARDRLFAALGDSSVRDAELRNRTQRCIDVLNVAWQRSSDFAAFYAQQR